MLYIPFNACILDNLFLGMRILCLDQQGLVTPLVMNSFVAVIEFFCDRCLNFARNVQG